jgi:hypothetical protein
MVTQSHAESARVLQIERRKEAVRLGRLMLVQIPVNAAEMRDSPIN